MITYSPSRRNAYDLGLSCHYCGRRLISAKTPPGTMPYYEIDDTGAPVLVDDYGLISYDHKLPKSRGGKSGGYNLVPCCRDCNERKADTDYLSYYEMMEPERTARQLEQALDVLRRASGIMPRQEYMIAGRAIHFAAEQMRLIAGMG